MIARLFRSKPRHGLLLAGVAVAAVAAGMSGALTAQAGSGDGAAGAVWHVGTIVSRNTFTADPQLAVSDSGDAVLGWVQGRAPVVCSEGPCRQPGGPWRGFKVMVAQGTAAGGLGRPIELSAHGYGHVFVAQLSSGVSYLAWDPFKGRGWRLVAVDRGRVSRPTVLPVNAQLQGLFTGRKREAAAVWATPGNPAWEIHYAFLGTRGRLGRQGNLAQITGHDFTYPSVAINDRGELAAVWTTAPQFGNRVFLATCDVRARCSEPRPLALPAAKPYANVALTDSGTVAVTVGARSGLWAAIGQVDRAGVQRMRVASTGTEPFAAPDGVAGVAATFTPASDSIAWTFLNPSTGRFSRPMIRSATAGASPPEVAASLSRRFVFDWPASNGLRASTGVGTRAGRPKVIPGSRDAAQPNFNPYDIPSDSYIGIDGRGDAIVTWQSGSHGLVEAVRLAH
jgi:hypothetical protein